MARKKNIYTPCIKAFLTEVAALNLLSFNARCVHKTDAKALARQIRSTPPNGTPPLRGAYLTSVDPFRPGKHILTFAGWTAQGKELEAVNEETQLGIQALVMCLAVEAMREYLIRVTGEAYWRLQASRKLTHKQWVKFEQAHPTHRTHRGTPTYYRAFVEWRGRNDMHSVVTLLRQLVPDLRTATVTREGINLFEYLSDVQAVRNAIIHRRGAVDAEWLSQLPKKQRAYVRSVVRTSVLHGDRRLLPCNEEVQRVLFSLCLLAHVIYKNVSSACGMNTDFLPGEG